MSQSSSDSPLTAPEPRLRLRVSRVAESHIRNGHPWVYSDSVRESNRQGRVGELAVIFDRNNRFLAVGLFDPDSPIQVRILHHGKPCTIDDAWLDRNLHQALAVRAKWFEFQGGEGFSAPGYQTGTEGPSPNPLPVGEGAPLLPSQGAEEERADQSLIEGLPSPLGERQGNSLAASSLGSTDTTGYRLINGESDHWPALVLDRYGSTYVLKLYSLAWLQRLELLQQLLVRALRPERIVLRLSRNIQEVTAQQFDKADGDLLFGSPLEAPPTFLETGILFEADVMRGQKTGFFLDQRENRRRIGGLAANRRVLNAFSFSGGFSLYAAQGGARTVTDLDISTHALESAKRNFRLNASEPKIAGCAHECLQADVFEWLRQKTDRQFDLLILDPPSLARREVDRAGAITAYHRLAADALPWLASGGILYAASCSGHVTAEEFFEAVRRAARNSGRRFTELETTGHAPDHPATFPEAQYLKGLYLRF